MSWILNTTFHVKENRATDFLNWLHTTMIPEIKAFGNGITYSHCLEIMVELADECKGYAVQINVDTFDNLMGWLNHQKAIALQMSLRKHFGDDVLAFNTPMRIFHV